MTDHPTMKRVLACHDCCCCLCVLRGSAGYGASKSAGDQDPATTLKVDVKLVNVFVTVTDDHGAPISGLKKEDFQLQEDGKDQKISVFDRESALPLSIVMAVDTSLSTRKDLPLEVASARRFARTILATDRRTLPLPVQRNSQRTRAVHTRPAADRSRDSIASRHGAATALYDALYLGSQSLLPVRDAR